MTRISSAREGGRRQRLSRGGKARAAFRQGRLGDHRIRLRHTAGRRTAGPARPGRHLFPSWIGDGARVCGRRRSASFRRQVPGRAGPDRWRSAPVRRRVAPPLPAAFRLDSAPHRSDPGRRSPFPFVGWPAQSSTDRRRGGRRQGGPGVRRSLPRQAGWFGHPPSRRSPGRRSRRTPVADHLGRLTGRWSRVDDRDTCPPDRTRAGSLRSRGRRRGVRVTGRDGRRGPPSTGRSISIEPRPPIFAIAHGRARPRLSHGGPSLTMRDWGARPGSGPSSDSPSGEPSRTRPTRQEAGDLHRDWHEGRSAGVDAVDHDISNWPATKWRCGTGVPEGRPVARAGPLDRLVAISLGCPPEGVRLRSAGGRLLGGRGRRSMSSGGLSRRVAGRRENTFSATASASSSARAGRSQGTAVRSRFPRLGRARNSAGRRTAPSCPRVFFLGIIKFAIRLCPIILFLRLCIHDSFESSRPSCGLILRLRGVAGQASPYDRRTSPQ